MIVDDSSRVAAITSCGSIRSNYAYNGTYGFIFQFGGASLYIFDSTRGKSHKYKIFSRSWYPAKGSGLKVLDIDFNKGFLLFETKSFEVCLDAFRSFCFRMFQDLKFSDFSPYNLNYTQADLFKNEL